MGVTVSETSADSDATPPLKNLRAAASGDSGAKLDALHALALGLAGTGHVQEAAGVFEQPVALAEALEDVFWLASSCSLINFGWHYHMASDHDLALQTTRRGLEVARAIGNVSGIIFATTNLGEIAFDLGDWDQAERHFAEAAPLGWYEGATTNPATNLLYLRLLRGDESAVPGLTRLADVPSSWAARYLAEWELLAGNVVAARDRLEGALEAGVAGAFRPGWEALRAESYLLLGELERAEAVVIPLAERTAPTSYPADWLQGLRVLGMIRARQVRSEEACTLFERALAESERFPFVQAQVHHAWGQVLQGRNEHAAARAHLWAALTIFNRLGASVYAARTEAILRAPDLQ